jgi:hypothetical protein
VSPEIVALLVLAGGAVAAVAFTLIVVATVDRSGASGRPTTGNERTGEREDEER